jgi:4'-phosphopantetheinyl transferase
VIATLFANATEPWPLRDGIVHVWRFACIGDADASVLSAEERAIAARFVSPAHRDAYMVQHASMRTLLARYLAIPAHALTFVRGPRGKPALPGRELELNLSHAADVALLAVARSLAVGVDIERIDASLDTRELGRIVLAPTETALGADRRGFLRIWCRKEACLKATGVGLLDDLTSVSVAGERVAVEGQSVYVQDLDMGPEHAAALATSAPCAPVSAAPAETFTW